MIASYCLSRALRKRASRVARPTTSGSTPLAAGSSVPVWPMRRSPRRRRIRSTTSWDVGPEGLSMTRRPFTKQNCRISGLRNCRIVGLSFDRLFDLRDEQFLERVDRAPHGAPRRVLMAAAAELLRHGADVDVAFGSHADAVLLDLDLLGEVHRLDLFDGERQVDQPFGVLVGAAGLARHLVIEIHDRDPARS